MGEALAWRAECVPAPATRAPCLLLEVILERSEVCLKLCIIFAHLTIANRYRAPPGRGEMPPEKAPARAAAAAKAKAKAEATKAKKANKANAKNANGPPPAESQSGCTGVMICFW